MLLNVIKKDWSGPYGMKQLFNAESRSGNCVDLSVDLGEEYTISTFDCWTSRWSFFIRQDTHANCLWVFGAQQQNKDIVFNNYDYNQI